MNKKRALCVGINDYPGFAADLSGCVNDAMDWTALLDAEGYEVETILDAEATRAEVLDVLSKLVAMTGFADRLVFTFSGHGTWIPDRDGDETDRRDEALCLYDYASGGLLTDDDLQRVLGQRAYGANVLVLSDSCHSGTVTRDAAMVGAVATHGEPKFVPPNMLVDGLTAERAATLEKIAASAPRRTSSLISGCHDREYSYDAWFGDRPNGAFTKAAISAFRGGISLGNWHNAIRAILPNDYFPQTPQLTALSRYRKYTKAI